MSSVAFRNHRILAVLGICLLAILALMLWARPLAGDRGIPRIAAVEEIDAKGEAVQVAARQCFDLRPRGER